jgi:hypothetical protein
MGVALRGGKEGGIAQTIKMISPCPLHSPLCPYRHIKTTIKYIEQTRHRWEGWLEWKRRSIAPQ